MPTATQNVHFVSIALTPLGCSGALHEDPGIPGIAGMLPETPGSIPEASGSIQENSGIFPEVSGTTPT